VVDTNATHNANITNVAQQPVFRIAQSTSHVTLADIVKHQTTH